MTVHFFHDPRMRVHWLQHVPFEDLGRIEPWLLTRGAQVTASRLFERPDLPSADSFDWLIIMGGPMSVHDESKFPWLALEKALIRQALLGGKRVLGVCLGAQLMAEALSARVWKNPHREIGWFPVERVHAPASGRLAALWPKSIEVLHWHGETFDLPGGAVHLARSAGCENQAFQWGERAFALQFHLETTPEGLRSLLENAREEMTPGPFVQSEEELLAGPASFRSDPARTRLCFTSPRQAAPRPSLKGRNTAVEGDAPSSPSPRSGADRFGRIHRFLDALLSDLASA